MLSKGHDGSTEAIAATEVAEVESAGAEAAGGEAAGTPRAARGEVVVGKAAAGSLDKFGIFPNTPARLHSNILLAPLDNVQALCDLTRSMNASFTGKRTRERLPRRGEVEKQQVTDAMGGNGIKDVSTGETFSRKKDDEFLEAASCLVTPDSGDGVLIFPDVFHRTQDIAVTRLAFIAEAF